MNDEKSNIRFYIDKNAAYTNHARELIWHSPNKWISSDGLGIHFYSAIRQGDWKLVYSMRTGIKELYNLKNDVGEANDVSVKHPEIVKQLSAMLGSKLREWEAPMPVNKQTGRPAPMPDEQ